MRRAISDDEQVTTGSAVEWDRSGPLPSSLRLTMKHLLTRNSVVVAAGIWHWGVGRVSHPLALGISALMEKLDLETQGPPMRASIPLRQALLLLG